jgi:CubicO group peptidase (beta-lactamase class C family)
MTLIDWLRAYFDPLGSNYSADGNFLSWRPGTLEIPEGSYAYSNLGFGLLGGIVELVAKQPFAEYCQRRIFDPLGMNDTGWYLTDIEVGNHAIPYGPDPDPRLPAPGKGVNESEGDNYHPYCLYSFPNYPDGLVRTSVDDLARFLRAYIGSGAFRATQILRQSTIDTMLTVSHKRQGLCWRMPGHLPADEPIWGHGGGDPGVSTTMDFNRQTNVGVIVFSNFTGWDLVQQVSSMLFEASAAV